MYQVFYDHTVAHLTLTTDCSLHETVNVLSSLFRCRFSYWFVQQSLALLAFLKQSLSPCFIIQPHTKQPKYETFSGYGESAMSRNTSISSREKSAALSGWKNDRGYSGKKPL